MRQCCNPQVDNPGRETDSDMCVEGRWDAGFSRIRLPKLVWPLCKNRSTLPVARAARRECSSAKGGILCRRNRDTRLHRVVHLARTIRCASLVGRIPGLAGGELSDSWRYA